MFRKLLITIFTVFFVSYCRCAVATPYVIEFSGTINGDSIGSLSSSFYGGEPFSGLISFNSAAGATQGGTEYFTVGEVMTEVDPGNRTKR